ncbi:hybrid sensor histidine kinase/response regulator [Shewanella maritima]|uniref:Hybrid sensor histidine kinase/response regulator n=1 Tax=Shewanella maritima TaxID=2520507 RepID=A0A411PD78_9GAMM|nr:response regulator [Shewanella maritima]QBF81468.1 hybrid sensor histidine kinase/response regulator [Shewanella maritima]
MMLENASSTSVLVVEDIDNMRLTIVKMLLTLGFSKVFQAKNGIEALEKLNEHDIKLVVSDIGMPQMDGMTMLTHIRKNRDWDSLPIVIISSVVEQSIVTNAIKLGVSQYIVKPFSQHILLDHIHKALANPVVFDSSVEPETANEPVSVVNNEPEKLSILIVDDVPENIHVIANTLKGDYQLRAATSGKKALEVCLSNNPPDLILLDIMMPEMDGLQVMEKINQHSQLSHIKVIFLSALSENENIVQGFELGAVDYITKPIVPTVLKARLLTHSNIIRAQKASTAQIRSMMESLKVRNDFERIMQHDLKNQLQVINSTTNSIRKNIKRPDVVTYMLNAVENGTLMINQIIDNMVMINRIEEGQYQFKPRKIFVAEIIDTAIDVNTVTVKEKRLEVESHVSSEICVMGETPLMASIINNLLQNAMQAAPNGSAVMIRANTDSDTTRIEIHNVGVIPNSIRDTFFEKYTTYGKASGTGMGTYAVKLMVEIQQGQVSFTSSVDEGTTLIVELQAG